MHKNEFKKQAEIASKQMEQGFSVIASALAHVMTEEEAHKHKALPKKAVEHKLQHEIESDLLKLKRRLDNGAMQLVQTLPEVMKTHPEINIEAVAIDLATVMKYLLTLSEHAEEYVQGLLHEKSVQEIAGMSSETLEALYQSAKYLYEHQQYEEAADSFGLLTLLNAKHPIFWLGLGNSEFFCHRYEPALTAYAMAVYVNPFDPTPHLYSCKCYEEIHELDNAVNALDLALYVLEQNQDESGMKEQIQTERQRLNKKLKK